MKRKDIKELSEKNIKQLEELIKKTQEEIVKLGLDLKVGKVKNIFLLKEKKKDLARLKTILKEKEMHENS